MCGICGLRIHLRQITEGGSRPAPQRLSSIYIKLSLYQSYSDRLIPLLQNLRYKVGLIYTPPVQEVREVEPDGVRNGST